MLELLSPLLNSDARLSKSETQEILHKHTLNSRSCSGPCYRALNAYIYPSVAARLCTAHSQHISHTNCKVLEMRLRILVV
jgi:hypothetical protein